MSAIAVLVYHYFVTDKQGTTLTSAKENTVIIRDTIVDTIYVRKTTYTPRIIYKDTMRSRQAQKIKDTTIILNDCFIYNVVTDTVVDDSNASFIMTDTLFMNRIISRSPDIRIYNRRVETNTVSTTTRGAGIYAGIMACGNMNKFGIGLSVNYVFPGKSNIGISYDLINKEVFVSYSKYLFGRDR